VSQRSDARVDRFGEFPLSPEQMRATTDFDPDDVIDNVECGQGPERDGRLCNPHESRSDVFRIDDANPELGALRSRCGDSLSRPDAESFALRRHHVEPRIAENIPLGFHDSTFACHDDRERRRAFDPFSCDVDTDLR
jgi:hypothetical protein